MTIVLLDAGPLGLVTNPRASPVRITCNEWLRSLLLHGDRVLVPEIADYEIRRELIRADRQLGLDRLDALAAEIGYLPLTTAVMRRAAEFWAIARRRGRPTAADTALDSDMILAAQAAAVAAIAPDVVVATTNISHLALFVDARRWLDINA